jgi:hypothetical protein
MIRESGEIVLPELDQQRPPFQFGVFEFDPSSGELRKHGLRLTITGAGREWLELRR